MARDTGFCLVRESLVKLIVNFFSIKYADIKLLIQKKCFITDIILDKLVKDGATSKKVTIGVAKEEDATRILHRLNGTYVEGQQIFIENVNKSQSNNNPVDMDAYSTYQQPQNDQNLMMASNQQMNNPNAWNMQMYGYGMPDQALVYQAGMNTQMMQGYGGYNAWMTSTGNPSMMQSNVMGYGNLQGQQGSQYFTTQGQFEGSGPGSQPRGSQNESGYGRTSGDRQNETGFSSSNSRNETGYASGSWNETGYGSGNQNERGYSSQQSYPNTQKDRGSGAQGFLRGSQQEDRGRRSPQPLMGSNQRGYSSGDFDKDRFDSGNQKDSRGYGGQSSWGNSQRETRDLSQNSWGNNRDRGFDRPREGNDTPRGRDGERPHFPYDERKRRYSPERGNTHRGNSREGFQSNSGFEGNQSRGFDRNRDSRDFSRAGPSRDSHPTKVAPKPLLELPSWPNSQPRPYGSDKPDFNKGPPRDNSKGRIQWNRNPGPPLSNSSPVKNPMPPKRAKVEPAVKVTVKEYDFDQKAVNRAISWRGEGVSVIWKEILEVHKKDFLGGKKAYQFGTKLLKKRINERLDEIIKKRYPGNPYPALSGPEIVGLYRDHHPVREDHKLFKFVFEDASVTALADVDIKPIVAATSAKLMGPPSGTKVPHVKTNVSPVKPKVPLKTFVKPSLADLLPPKELQTKSDKLPRPWVAPAGPKKLMLGPNALKNKPKPYNVEKRERTLQKNAAKQEFLDENLYRCGIPAQEEALNKVLDDITNVFNAAIDAMPTTSPEEKIIGASIQEKAAPEFRAMVRLHTIKRMLNITSTLILRIFVHGGKATKENVEMALKPYGALNLKSTSQAKAQMFVAGVKTYYNYDRLCNTPGIPVPGKYGTSTITAKPLHLTMPLKYRRFVHQKKYVDLTGDNDDSENFGGDGEGDGDDVDDDDDDLQGDDDDDDDVIEVIRDNEVIELSGDETTLNVPDEGSGDKKEVNTKSENKEANKSGEVNKSDGGTEKTVDLTLEGDDDEGETVDERMSAAIAKQMGDSVVEIDEEEIREDDLEDY